MVFEADLPPASQLNATKSAANNTRSPLPTETSQRAIFPGQQGLSIPYPASSCLLLKLSFSLSAAKKSGLPLSTQTPFLK